ncbi:hypothetical protein ES703_08674 [subsurface metagenome]
MAFGEDQGGGQPLNMEALIKKVLSDEESRKKQQEQINGMEHNLRIIGNMLCDEAGNCKVATKEDLTRASERQATKGDLSEFTGQELWNQIKKTPRYVKDVEDVHLKKLKEEETYLKKALEDKALVGKVARLLCDDEGCRVVFNEEVDKVKAGKGKAKGEKEFFLTKEK